MLFFDFYLNSIMAYTNCYIDLTTNSATYNPTSPQGQWAWHRFGKRSYPNKQLPLKVAKKFIKELDSDCKTIFLKSFFGDSLHYKYIVSLVKYAKSLEKDVFIFTYASGYNESIVKQLAEFDVRFYVHCTGINDMLNLVHQNQTAGQLDKFLSITKSKTIIEYHVYQHNLVQIPDVIDLCCIWNAQLKIQRGSGYGEHLAHIITDDGKWLHDISLYKGPMPNENDFLSARTRMILCKNRYESIIENFTPLALMKTAFGSNLLKPFTVNSKSKNILDKPKLEKEYIDFNTIVPELKLQNDLYLSVTGYVFTNVELYEIFSNALCNDWHDALTKYATDKSAGRVQYQSIVSDDYVERVGSILERLTEVEFDKLHAGHNSLVKILEYNSSSFGYRYI